MRITTFVLSIFLFAGCGTTRQTSKASQLDVPAPRPTEIHSVSDLPAPLTSRTDIEKTGIIRVIGESAPNQTSFDAIEAAKGIAQVKILLILKGVNGNREDGVIKVSGMIRTFECGTFYDPGAGKALACMEAPVK